MNRTLLSMHDQRKPADRTHCDGERLNSMSAGRVQQASCCADPVNAPRLIEATGRVVGSQPGFVTVETQRASACASCGVVQSCGTAVLGKLVGGAETRLTLPSERQHAVGERVVITIPETGLLIGAAIAYLMPIAGLILGALIAAGIGGTESVTVIGAGVGLIAGMLGSFKVTRSSRMMMRLVPVRLQE